MVWYNQYNQKFINSPGNDAAGDPYRVKIIPAVVLEGVWYWKCIGIHHLTPQENVGKHSVFLEVLDENNQRVPAYVGWTWVGRNAINQPALPVKIEKPNTEPGADIAMHGGQIVSIWVNGRIPEGKDPTDKVENLHTGHPDEAPGNTWGHHSFYVVFKRVQKGVDNPPPPNGGTTNPPPPDPDNPVESFTQFVPIFENDKIRVRLIIEVK